MILRKFDHRTGLALRSAAEKTEFFGFVSLFLYIFAAVYYFIIIIVLAHNDSFLYPLIRNSTVLLQDSRPLDHYAYLTELYHTIPL